MESERAIDALSALAQPTRLDVFRRLVRAGPEGMVAGAIAEATCTRANTLSAHLTILTRAGLVAGEREGRQIRYRADFAAARELIAYLLEDCCDGRPEICAPLLDSSSKDCRNGLASSMEGSEGRMS